jgi:hypothetical protein
MGYLTLPFLIWHWHGHQNVEDNELIEHSGGGCRYTLNSLNPSSTEDEMNEVGREAKGWRVQDKSALRPISQ